MILEQRDFLVAALTDTREKLFDVVDCLLDQTKLIQARERVKNGNKLNTNKFDPDLANDTGKILMHSGFCCPL